MSFFRITYRVYQKIIILPIVYVNIYIYHPRTILIWWANFINFKCIVNFFHIQIHLDHLERGTERLLYVRKHWSPHQIQLFFVDPCINWSPATVVSLLLQFQLLDWIRKYPTTMRNKAKKCGKVQLWQRSRTRVTYTRI